MAQKWRTSLPSKLKIDYRLFVGMLLVDRLSFFLLVKIVNFIVSQFKIKINYLYFCNTPYYHILTTMSPSNYSHIYKAKVKKVSLG